MKNHKLFLTAVIIIVVAVSCGKNSSKSYTFKYQTDPQVKELIRNMPEYPETKFVVFSDAHFHDPLLGTSGEAFQHYLIGDRKLLHLSGEILDSVIKKIKTDKPDFILIPGDMTKDGEKINHEQFSKKIGALTDITSKIYVIPGNHDVRNGHAFRYNGSVKEPVDSVTPEEFKVIYKKFGYSNQVAADVTSLSYVAEPVKGLWVLALDSCLWRNNKPGEHSGTDGEFSEETLRWIEEMLIKSKIEKKALVAFMHHGAMEHYPYNEKFYGQYVVNNSNQITDLFAAYGVKVVFTGHYHAQDITLKKTDNPGRFVYDIETGSLVTYPSPYRFITISRNQKLNVESRITTSVASHEKDFEKYSYDFLFKGTVRMADDALAGYKVSEKDMKVLSPAIAKAYITHLSGDEIKPDSKLSSEGLGLLGKLALMLKGNLIEGWYTDLAPSDNRIEIDLKSGDWVKK